VHKSHHAYGVTGNYQIGNVIEIEKWPILIACGEQEVPVIIDAVNVESRQKSLHFITDDSTKEVSSVISTLSLCPA
jgi:hypothetical protein